MKILFLSMQVIETCQEAKGHKERDGEEGEQRV
jgi:hypothetical protein